MNYFRNLLVSISLFCFKIGYFSCCFLGIDSSLRYEISCCSNLVEDALFLQSNVHSHMTEMKHSDSNNYIAVTQPLNNILHLDVRHQNIPSPNPSTQRIVHDQQHCIPHLLYEDCCSQILQSILDACFLSAVPVLTDLYLMGWVGLIHYLSRYCISTLVCQG
jgi:hypothetical protein